MNHALCTPNNIMHRRCRYNFDTHHIHSVLLQLKCVFRHGMLDGLNTERKLSCNQFIVTAATRIPRSSLLAFLQNGLECLAPESAGDAWPCTTAALHMRTTLLVSLSVCLPVQALTLSKLASFFARNGGSCTVKKGMGGVVPTSSCRTAPTASCLHGAPRLWHLEPVIHVLALEVPPLTYRARTATQRPTTNQKGQLSKLHPATARRACRAALLKAEH